MTTPYRIGILGSKSYASLHHVDALLDRLYASQQAGKRTYRIVSATEPMPITGRKRQARDRPDECAIRYARGIGLETDTPGKTRADWLEFDGDVQLEKRRFLLPRSDALAAFWDGQSTNTADILHSALTMGIRVEVYQPDGLKMEPEWVGEAVRQAIRGFTGGSHARTSGCQWFEVGEAN